MLYRKAPNNLEVFLVHPGGPFWAKKDEGAWSIPKGEFPDTEEPLNAAIREFEEETGFSTSGNFVPLSSQKQKGGKVILAWALEGNVNPQEIKSNLFEMEWPPRSGKKQQFPEVDKAAWFTLTEARIKINAGQVPFLDELEQKFK